MQRYCKHWNNLYAYQQRNAGTGVVLKVIPDPLQLQICFLFTYIYTRVTSYCLLYTSNIANVFLKIWDEVFIVIVHWVYLKKCFICFLLSSLERFQLSLFSSKMFHSTYRQHPKIFKGDCRKSTAFTVYTWVLRWFEISPYSFCSAFHVVQPSHENWGFLQSEVSIQCEFRSMIPLTILLICFSLVYYMIYVFFPEKDNFGSRSSQGIQRAQGTECDHLFVW